MKHFFTLLLLLSVIISKAQTPLAQAYHGCGGATITAFSGDPTWSSVTYEFQKQTGGTWTTVLTSINNWGFVIPGDVIVATAYRVLLRNDLTQEERISNSVTINPALFFIAVSVPNFSIKPYWALSGNPGLHYFEIQLNFSGLNVRPPFIIEYKKASSLVWLNRTSATGIFITNVDPNEPYNFRIRDYCGNLSPEKNEQISSAAFASQTAIGCSGATVQLSVTGSANLNNRLPFTFAFSPLPAGTLITAIPNSILDTLTYQYSAGTISNIPPGLYVVRAKDVYGVLSNYSTLSVSGGFGAFIVSYGPGSSFCLVNITLQNPGGPTGPYVAGIRSAGSGLPYVFSSNLSIANIIAGKDYELVLKNSCGNLSSPSVFNPPAWDPVINSVDVTKVGCNNRVTVNTTTCSNTAEYRLKLVGGLLSPWQSSNVFDYISPTGCDTVFVREGNSQEVSKVVCVPVFEGDVIASPSSGFCGSPWEIAVSNVYNGVAPYLYAISFDSINFTPFSSNSIFNMLMPGTYDVMVKDACGNIFRSKYDDQQQQVGDWFYVNEIGIRSACASNSELAGGFIRFGIQQPYNIFGTASIPYQYELKEVKTANGNNIQYGNVVYRGQTDDTTFTIAGLQAGKGYGIFITNTCGEPVTAGNRAINNFFIPAENLPQPAITVNSTTCNQPFIEASNLPNGGVIQIYKGRDTTGAAINLATPSTSTVLLGGYYTIKVSTPNFNGCTWMQLYERYVSTTDSTSAGTFDNSLGGICKADSSIVQLKKYVLAQTPGGIWAGNIPDSNWVNRDSGQFRTTGLADGIYDFEYSVQTLCGANQLLTFSLSIDLVNCGLSAAYSDVVSASSALGCNNYAGDEWFDVLDAEGRLRYSINPGNGNSIQSACWGARFRFGGATLRTIMLNNSPVYFSNRNFYIEPNQVVVGANPVRVRLYYSNDDIEGLLYNLQLIGFPSATVNDLRILKKKAGPGSPVDLEVDVDAGAQSSLYSLIIPSVHRYGSGPFASWYFEFEINSFSELALIYTPGTVLPVSWLSVTGQINGGKSLIKWSTASEINSASFTIEYSADGIGFTALQNIPAAGNYAGVNHYEFIHSTPKQGLNYYRIRQTDRDGRYSYSKIVSLQYSKDGRLMLLAPNPAKEKLTVWFAEIAGSNCTIRIYNNIGQVIQQQPVAMGANQLQINISKLQPGYYWLQLIQSGSLQSLPFIKQ